MTQKQRIEQLEGLLEYDRLKRVEQHLNDVRLALDGWHIKYQEMVSDRNSWRQKCEVLMNENQYIKDCRDGKVLPHIPKPPQACAPWWRQIFK